MREHNHSSQITTNCNAKWQIKKKKHKSELQNTMTKLEIQ